MRTFLAFSTHITAHTCIYVLPPLYPRVLHTHCVGTLGAFRCFVDFCDELVVGNIFAIDRVNVKLIKGRIVLTLDKWSAVKPTNIAITGDVLEEPNFSDMTYGIRLKEGDSTGVLQAEG